MPDGISDISRWLSEGFSPANPPVRQPQLTNPRRGSGDVHSPHPSLLPDRSRTPPRVHSLVIPSGGFARPSACAQPPANLQKTSPVFSLQWAAPRSKGGNRAIALPTPLPHSPRGGRGGSFLPGTSQPCRAACAIAREHQDLGRVGFRRGRLPDCRGRAWG